MTYTKKESKAPASKLTVGTGLHETSSMAPDNRETANCKMDLSFSGAGFMGCYFFGVVDCWNKYVPRDRVNRVAGASAGSLIAAYYLMDLPLGECLREIIGLTEEIRRRPLGVFDRSHQIVDVLPKILDRLFPEDAHKRVSGRLHVAMTRFKDMKKVIVNEFETRKDLIDALNCSCFIPVWSGNHVSTYKGVKHIDGGFTDNLPVFDEHTIRICCFSGATDISPYDRAKMELLSTSVRNMPLYLTFANCRRFRKALFPPTATYILDLLERGFHDTKDFILTNDLIQCDACYRSTCPKDQPIFAKLSPTITPRASPSVSRACSFSNLAATGDENERSKSSGMLLKPSKVKSPKMSSSKSSSFTNLLHEKLLRSSSPDSGQLSSPDTAQHKVDESPSGGENRYSPPAIVVECAADEEQQETRTVSTTEHSDLDDSAVSPNVSDHNGHALQAITSAPSQVLRTESGSPDSSGLELADSSSNDSSIIPSEQSPRKRPRAGDSPVEAGWREMSESNKMLAARDRFTLVPDPLPSCPPSPNLNRHCVECIRMRQEARRDLICEEIKQEADKYRGTEEVSESSLKSKLASPLRWIRRLGCKSSYKFTDEVPTQ